MKIKTGKEEIGYLLEKVIDTHERTTGQRIIRNTNPKNYEDIARLLSSISNELPNTAQQLDHDLYPPDPNPKQVDYPHRKYDITGVQVKDAYHQLVANPRSFLVDACYIYLYGVGRKGFSQNPRDTHLIEGVDASVALQLDEQEALRQQLATYQQEQLATTKQLKEDFRKKKRLLLVGLLLCLSLLGLISARWVADRNEWATVRKDLNILPYQPTQAEIDSLSGIWLYYTGAPQARANDPNRFHQVANNLVEISYKNGYFIFNRHGANIDHIGYMQFEAPALVSIYSRVKNNSGNVESPIHALLRLDKGKSYLTSIATTWSFDMGDGNDMIGIRNVFIKQGKGGSLEEITNTPENANCHCKIMKWVQSNNQIKTFQLKYRLLDTLANESLKALIDEKSILLREPREGVILTPALQKDKF
ncbi:hypothetical protein [Spirosoma radiotolerans]|uniref:Uncharacterized protein n=1 Tax=Spirosoma radiotolerans TaxID=1379870 RepID=A0A0E3V5Q4_9BACT|nr:hypothetical protein [Spirosoma radiotolerans]AKD53841.1 hypothetical protein SD10_01895 [Spirosoma radiotolerans]